VTITYSILLNDPATHVVTLRWQDGDNFRDEVFDLNLVYPGATTMFAAMGLPFDYDAALTYLNRVIQGAIDSGNAHVVPPEWDTTNPFQQIIATTPEADRPGYVAPAAS
jgi:hypothetical protein